MQQKLKAKRHKGKFHGLKAKDNKGTEVMLKEEKAYRKARMGNVELAPVLNTEGVGVIWLKLIIKARKGRQVSSRKLEKLQKKAKMEGMQQCRLPLEWLIELLQQKEENYKRKKKDVKSLWYWHLMKLANQWEDLY